MLLDAVPGHANQGALSLLRTGKVKGVRFETLTRLCAVLECQPGDDGGSV